MFHTHPSGRTSLVAYVTNLLAKQDSSSFTWLSTMNFLRTDVCVQCDAPCDLGTYPAGRRYRQLFTPSLDKSRFGLVLSGAAAAGGREESSPVTVVCVMLLFLRILMASWVRVGGQHDGAGCAGLPVELPRHLQPSPGFSREP
jgi:hypothetical protein